MRPRKVSSTAVTAPPPPARMPAAAPRSVSPRHQMPSTSSGQNDEAATAKAKPAKGKGVATSNPLLERWTAPFEVPPFDKVRAEHFLPIRFLFFDGVEKLGYRAEDFWTGEKTLLLRNTQRFFRVVADRENNVRLGLHAGDDGSVEVWARPPDRASLPRSPSQSRK